MPRAPMSRGVIIIAIVLFVIQVGRSVEATSVVGVNYGTLGNNLPSPDQVAHLVNSSTSIARIKLYDADASVLHAFAGSGVSIVVGIPNEQLESLGSNPTAAAIWVKQHIVAFLPHTNIIAIAAGNEALTIANGSFSSFLMPCINNVYAALASLGLHDRIKISTPHSFAVLAMSYPPSSGTFRPSFLQVIIPLLQFLSKTGSPLMINAYPYFAYHNDPAHVSLNYALLRPGNVIVDPRTKLRYTNLLDAQLDATYAAMQALGVHDVAVTISETGWPSRGASDEPGANLTNARAYVSNLVDYVASGVGTPARPNASVDVFIFALFNENEKPGPVSEQYYGLFTSDGTAVYDIGLLKSPSSPGPSSSPSSPSPSSSPSSPPPPPPRSTNRHIWCIAKPNADDSVLLKGLNFACGEGSADCQAIQRGGGCYTPETLNSHASYAFNAYYQKHGRNFWNCYFAGVGMLSITDPSYGACKYQAT
ncbi:glucan endo-1,3-beta-D-glucosidase [Selaginella moellendorffii]|uniref:glucan endo-1,3-beta-D-glucosidase n=1 Tax=Selaginella moellendorffii TaxID=88036 RepID=UPI000D1C7FEA|nr:glucan endo-1,3-beta-D-glucosidase [Selaginella moellendorffii]|eukprot:XP_024543079.1 glucan endo-1,3-beta-D-glucosidase [Selaginella moellendorffii]